MHFDLPPIGNYSSRFRAKEIFLCLNKRKSMVLQSKCRQRQETRPTQTMAHPTEWWLKSEEKGSKHRAYQSIDDCAAAPDVDAVEEQTSHHQDHDENSSNNPLHNFLNNSILSYKHREATSQGSELHSSISNEESISLDSQIEPPHKTLSVLFFDVIRFVAINADCRLINTELMPMVWSGVGKTVRQSIRHGNVSGMSDEKMEVLHVALRYVCHCAE